MSLSNRSSNEKKTVNQFPCIVEAFYSLVEAYDSDLYISSSIPLSLLFFFFLILFLFEVSHLSCLFPSLVDLRTHLLCRYILLYALYPTDYTWRLSTLRDSLLLDSSNFSLVWSFSCRALRPLNECVLVCWMCVFLSSVLRGDSAGQGNNDSVPRTALLDVFMIFFILYFFMLCKRTCTILKKRSKAFWHRLSSIAVSFFSSFWIGCCVYILES